MTIDLSYISQSRLEHIHKAESADAAVASMNLLDSLIDKVFRGGAKEAAIRALYATINHPSDDDGPGGTAQQMRNFLDMRNVMLPEHRQRLTLELTENADETWDYAMRLDGHLLREHKGIQEEANIAELKHTRNAIAVDDHLCKLQNYAPTAASLVHRSDSFLIEQGKTGDCYALATMMGIMTNPATQKRVEGMAEVTQDNQLRLKLEVRPDASNIRDTDRWDPDGSLELDMETLATICADDAELALMRDKGYDLSLKNDVLQVDISEDKLKQIIGETRSAHTNSLIVNILEHFSGNLLLRLDKVAEETEFTQLEKDGAADSGFALIDHARVRHSGLRSDRESILAHKDRAGNYDPLIANLLGYGGGAVSLQPGSVNGLSTQLKYFDRSERCLASGGAKGFVYVGMKYGQADAHGAIHGHHALLLQQVEYNADKEPVGVYLQNPWGNRREPEYYSLADLMGRKVNFAQYYPLDL